MDSHLPPRRIGMIIPSSNVTMEIEMPELLRRQEIASGHRFTLHASRLRLQKVTPEALERMNDAADEAVDALCDAHVDAIVYASVAALLHRGGPFLGETQNRLAVRATARGRPAPVVTSTAWALVKALRSLKAARVTMITPFRKALTQRVAATLAECGIVVTQSRSLDIEDNAEVGRLDPIKLLSLASHLDFSGSDALVISGCGQMPSLAIIEEAEQRFGLPVVSAVTATALDLLNRLEIEPQIDNAGMLLRTRTPTLMLP